MNNEQIIYKMLGEFYKHYAVHPNSSNQLLLQQAQKKPFLFLAKAIYKKPLLILKYLFFTILTKLTKPLTKLATKNSSQKPS
ncbi:MAG: hypothetical protein EOL93_09600 [Epsilonproteobacteria bacterium]|nr:hypothetical protein [Campylobacterota bacterium]